MKHENRPRIGRLPEVFAFATVVFGFSPAGFSQQFNLVVDSKSSTLASDSSISVPIAGTLIGNYDAAANPGGTQTRPGLFGGSGNNPINTSLTLGGDGAFTAHPAGGMQLNVDLGAGQITLQSLYIDVLQGTPAGLDLSIGLLYDTFHTVAPNAIFPGGITLTLPLGTIELQALTLSQDGAAPAGVLIPTGGGQYTFAIVASGLLSASVDVLGSVTDFADVPVPLALGGTLTISGNTATVEIAISQDVEQTIKGPFRGGSITDQALDVPTILPPGNTAHLLFNGDVESIGVALSFTGAFVASGPGFLPGDVDQNGAVDMDDLLRLIGNWGSCTQDPCDGDLNGDGAVEHADLDLLLANWT